MLKKSSNNIEKVLIGATIFSVLARWFFNEDGFGYANNFLLISLLALYLLVSEKNIYKLFFVGLIPELIGKAGFAGEDINLILIYFSSAFYTAFGIIIILKAIGDSRKYGNFELLNFLAGFFILIYPGYIALGLEEVEIVRFYSFALCFVVFTIMYNENLWTRYASDEQKLFTYIVVVALIQVLQFSFKYI
ncbi:MAG: hypothetical protein ACK4ND_05710 [Cytophagaceae bacterium]